MDGGLRKRFGDDGGLVEFDTKTWMVKLVFLNLKRWIAKLLLLPLVILELIFHYLSLTEMNDRMKKTCK